MRSDLLAQGICDGHCQEGVVDDDTAMPILHLVGLSSRDRLPSNGQRPGGSFYIEDFRLMARGNSMRAEPGESFKITQVPTMPGNCLSSSAGPLISPMN